MILRLLLTLTTTLYTLLLLPPAVLAAEEPSEDRDRRVSVLLFYSKDCRCKEILELLLPKLKKRFGERLNIKSYDVDKIENYKKLVEYETRYNDTDNELPIALILSPHRQSNEVKILSEEDEISQKLEVSVEAAVKEATLYTRPPEQESKESRGPPTPENASNTQSSVRPDSRSSAALSTYKPCYLAYFTKAGCQKCRRISYDLEAIQREFPSLTIREINIISEEGKKLNEAICAKYRVPEKRHLIAPAIFIGEDYLIDKNVKGTKVRALARKYSDVGTEIPWDIPAEMRKKAASAIVGRFRSFGVLTVALAGLIDGINPCAFATMIFFISYLAVVGRKGKEILSVGAAFTLGVFTAYLAIGLGLTKAIGFLSHYDLINTLITWLIIVFTYSLAILSLRDFRLALKGNIKDISLQLPKRLKMKIHRVIAKRSKARYFVMAAFLAGLTVSLLEFVCTGQVYLPVIRFVLSLEEHAKKATLYLIITTVRL